MAPRNKRYDARVRRRKAAPAHVKIIAWSDADKCYVGSAPPLVGECCRGRTEADVLAQLNCIVQSWSAEFAGARIHRLPAPKGYATWLDYAVAHIDARSLQNESGWDPHSLWPESVSTEQIREAAHAELRELRPASRAKLTVKPRAHMANGVLSRREAEITRLPKTASHNESAPMLNVHPGELLRKEFMVSPRLTPRALAKAANVSLPMLNEILAAKRAVDAETDRRLCTHFRQSPGYWLRVQAAYDAGAITPLFGSVASSLQLDPTEKGKAREVWADSAAIRKKSASSDILNKIAEKMIKAPTKAAARKLKEQYLSGFYGAPMRWMEPGLDLNKRPRRGMKGTLPDVAKRPDDAIAHVPASKRRRKGG
jgi:antitoxin HigA-1